GRLDVVELPVADGPPEGGHAHGGEHDGERNEGEEDVHRGVSMRVAPHLFGGEARGMRYGWVSGFRNEGCRVASVTTSSDDTGMATAATSGVTRPATAAVAPTAL